MRAALILVEIISSDEDDIIELTALQPILFPQQRSTGNTRRERRKQERRVSRLEERIKELDEEESRVAQEYEDMQTALAMSIAQEEKDREASERKLLREEQQAAYLESLAKDRAVCLSVALPCTETPSARKKRSG